MTKLRFGNRILNYGRDASRDALIRQAKIVDEEGYYSLWVAERLVVPAHANQSWSMQSPACFEVVTLLSYVAALTERVRLGTFVLLAPLRNPIVLAKQVATLDEMSKGRVILGLGLGWMRQEFSVSNVDIHERGARTDEMIRFLRAVWRKDKDVVEYRGKFTRLVPMLFDPKPRQDYLPIWIGGESDAALRRTGRLGDGWLSNTWKSPSKIGEGAERIRQVAESAGRSAKDITVSCKLVLRDVRAERTAAIRKIEKLQEAGVTHIMADFERKSASEYCAKIKLFSREIMKSF